MRMGRLVACLLAAGVVLVSAAPSFANVFASGLQQTGPNSLSYILNEGADTGVTVEVWQVGGGLVHSENLGPQTKGTHNWTWDATGYSLGNNYKARIIASDDGYSGWTQISTDQTSTSFYSPVGVSTQTSQSSPNFGKIYVSESYTANTGFGRSVTSGIYLLAADQTDLGHFTGGRDWTAAGNSSPFKSTLGPDGHLYVADFSNDLLFEFNDDLSVATQLIDASNKTAGQYVESVYVEGTGADRKLYLVNSAYLDGRVGLIRYDIGNNTMVATGDTGTQYIGPGYFAFYPRDVARDSDGNWYMNQYRFTAGQAPPVTKFLDGAPPINTAAWEADSNYTGSYGLDIFEGAGKRWVAYGDYYTGLVVIFDMDTGAFVDSFDAGNRVREVAFDAAGNIITGDNSIEWLRIWSPGDGSNSYSTDSWFTMVPEPSSLLVLLAGLPMLIRRRKS